MKLVAGLGNPGRQYQSSRHNLGFEVIDAFSKRYGIAVEQTKHKAFFGRGQLGELSVALAKPITFMNRSGESLAEIVRFYKLPLADVLVIVDDIALPLGRLRVRPRGSAGGHNGLKDIILRCGDDGFSRLRIGIGQPSQRTTVGHVLGDFSPAERAVVDAAVTESVDAVHCWLCDGPEEAMNRFNRRADSGDG